MWRCLLQVLFFVQPSDPVCLDPADPATCTAFACPSCFAVVGDTSCRGGAVPPPAAVCGKWKARAEQSTVNSHQACTERPLAVCVDATAGTYTEPGVLPLLSPTGAVAEWTEPQCTEPGAVLQTLEATFDGRFAVTG